MKSSTQDPTTSPATGPGDGPRRTSSTSEFAALIPVGVPDQPRRVMIVEDEALIALDLERRLGRLGFDVVGVADNLEEAVELFAETRPDLVLMDIFIRGASDGIDTARAIGKISDTPVIFLTAYADEDTVRRAAQTSPYGYLLKPFDERTLFATITVALERYAADTRVRLLGAAVAAANVGILLVDAAGDARKTLFVNDAFVRMSGHPRELLLGQRPCLLARDPEQEVAARLQAALAERIQADGIIEGVNARGERFWSSVTISPVPDASGQVTHMLIFHKDVTRERDAEAVIVESQRLELTGRLTAGIAHDFNNVLCAIAAFADLARDGLQDAQRSADMDEVLHAARRGQILTRKLLDFSRRSEPEADPSSDVSRVIVESRGMCERLAGPRVAFEIKLDPAAIFVRIDSTSLEQVLLNLVANARDAMPRGGKISVRASRVDDAAGADGPRRIARIEVRDTGVGMEPAVAARIFEPLFTTKARGAGTGLGLSTCRMLVERAGGTIGVRTAPGEGSTFTVELPMIDRPLQSRKSEAPSTPIVRIEGARCLLVEDDASLRRVYARALTDAGFAVTEAPTAETAIRELDTLGARVDLVVTDMVLPGLGGDAVLAHAARTCPAAARLVVTGYFDRDDERLDASVEVLWKPFTTGTLVRRALDCVQSARTRGPSTGERVPLEQSPSAAADRSVARPSGDAGSKRPSLAPARADAADPRSPAVLLVEDDESLRRALAAVLEGRGLRVIAVGTGLEGLSASSEVELAAAVLDVNLPDMSGIDLLSAIRKRDSLLPTLVVTGDASAQTVQQALRARATSYLTKPLVNQTFVEEVERAIADGQVARLQQKLLMSKAGAGAMLLDLQGTGHKLDEALQGLTMVYQPIVRAYDRSLFAYEALLRSRSPSLPGPAQILAAAEALGRMEELGRAVRASIADTLRENPQRHEPVFVNLHPMELRSALLTADDEPLLPFASRVVLEVTERASLGGSQSLSSTLSELRSAGYRIALDDLGEGYAGLSWLVKLTPDVAKLDMSLVRDIHASRLKRELVASLVGVCRRAHTTVVAEGVETAAEASVLIDLGCDLLQGYHFARPGPAFPTVSG